MTEERRVSDTIEFPVDEMERAIADLIPLMPPPAKWAAFNALRHLNRAWAIRKIDFEMAIMRCITAEEEAATALFRALQRRGYKGADRLKPRDHVHKNAVIPFIDAVSRVFARFAEQLPPATLELDRDVNPPLMKLRLTVPHPVTGELLFAWPQPPLHFSTTYSGVSGVPRPEDFSSGIDEVMRGAGATSILDHLRDHANKRNRILYAATNGYRILETEDADKAHAHFKRNVYTILRIYLLVDPYPQQNFVEQSLFAFLKMLKKLPDDIDF